VTGTTFRGKQRRFLRGLGVQLKPAVFIGKAAITGADLAELSQALDANELVKVRLLDSVEGDRKDVAADLAERSSSELVQVLGRTVLLFRRNEEEPKITLPA
jgi:RNA-binding protein